jgi:hypothetical protein
MWNMPIGTVACQRSKPMASRDITENNTELFAGTLTEADSEILVAAARLSGKSAVIESVWLSSDGNWAVELKVGATVVARTNTTDTQFIGGPIIATNAAITLTTEDIAGTDWGDTAYYAVTVRFL